MSTAEVPSAQDLAVALPGCGVWKRGRGCDEDN